MGTSDNRWRAILTMSSDHAGINKLLGLLEREMLYSLARIEDSRHVRDYLGALLVASMEWREANPHKAPWDK
jgi:hypothetical protein